MLLRERNPEQEGDAMGGKKDIPRTVRLDEDLDAWAQSSAAECECSFSDLVRTALLLAVPRSCGGWILTILTARRPATGGGSHE